MYRYLIQLYDLNIAEKSFWWKKDWHSCVWHHDKRGTLFLLQTITSAMSTLTPPVSLEDPSNQSKVDYILEVSSSPDFDYPPVSQSLRFVCVTCQRNETSVTFALAITHRPSRAKDRKSPRDNRHRTRCITSCFLNREQSAWISRVQSSRKENVTTHTSFSFANFARANVYPDLYIYISYFNLYGISIISRDFDWKAALIIRIYARSLIFAKLSFNYHSLPLFFNFLDSRSVCF